jgi:hypothetical protein
VSRPIICSGQGLDGDDRVYLHRELLPRRFNNGRLARLSAWNARFDHPPDHAVNIAWVVNCLPPRNEQPS